MTGGEMTGNPIWYDQDTKNLGPIFGTIGAYGANTWRSLALLGADGAKKLAPIFRRHQRFVPYRCCSNQSPAPCKQLLLMNLAPMSDD